MDNILIIDTSTNCVALSIGSSTEQSQSVVMAQHARHSENIMVALDELLKKTEISRKEISAIGVGIGPGMFTGLRVGIAVAHSYAHSLNIPVVFLSSLEIVAKSTSKSNGVDGKVLVVRDARRNELYYAQYLLEDSICESVTVDTSKISTSVKRIEQEKLISPDDFLLKIKTFDGSMILDDVVRNLCGHELDQHKTYEAILDPSSMIDHVKRSVDLSVVGDVFTPMPLYIRKSDAELSWGTK